MWDTFEFQTFCEFCSRCFTSGIVWTPPPLAECIAGHIHTECSLSSKDVPVLCMWGFAHVCSLRNVVLFFTRHLWLFSLRYFPRVLFILLWKSYTSCFLDRGTTVWYIVMAVLFFFLRGNFAILIRKTWSLCELQKHKHMPKEFQGNNLASWFKLEASCMKRGRPHTTFPWFLQGTYPGTPSDAIPLTLGYLGQLAVEDCCILAHLCLVLLKSQLCNSLLCVLQNRRGTSERAAAVLYISK